MKIRSPFDKEDETFFLLRYGETGLKSNRVKNRFLRKLCTNLEERFLHAEVDCYLETAQGRVYAYPGDFKKGVEIISSTFGIVSFSPAISLDTSDLDEICKRSVEYSQWLIKAGESFAVRTRRVGHHDYSSQDVNVRVGGEIIQNNSKKGLSVDLGTPNRVLYIEIRNKTTYFYHQKIHGPGGFPYGVSGRSICLVGSRTSLLAAYLMMKRGNRLIIHYTPQIYLDPIGFDEITAFFKKFIPSPNVQRSSGIDGGNILPAMCTICKEKRCDGIVVGFELDTLIEKLVEDHTHPNQYPIFYPVIGFSKDEIEERIALLYDGRE